MSLNLALAWACATLSDESRQGMSDHILYSEDPLEVYLWELTRIPAPDRSEEIRCMEHVRASDQLAQAARMRLVEANLHLVVQSRNAVEATTFTSCT